MGEPLHQTEHYQNPDQKPELSITDFRHFLEARSLSYGEMIADEYGRMQYGPVFAEFIAGKVSTADPSRVIELDDVLDRLRSQSVMRQHKLQSYTIAKRAAVKLAKERASFFPFLERTIELSRLLEDTEGFVIAEDVLAAAFQVVNKSSMNINSVE